MAVANGRSSVLDFIYEAAMSDLEQACIEVSQEVDVFQPPSSTKGSQEVDVDMLQEAIMPPTSAKRQNNSAASDASPSKRTKNSVEASNSQSENEENITPSTSSLQNRSSDQQEEMSASAAVNSRQKRQERRPLRSRTVIMGPAYAEQQQFREKKKFLIKLGHKKLARVKDAESSLSIAVRLRNVTISMASHTVNEFKEQVKPFLEDLNLVMAFRDESDSE